MRMYCECDRDPAAVSPCIHFFSCIAVFASDERLSAEFSNFIECVNSLPEAVVNDVGRLREAGNQRVIKILGKLTFLRMVCSSMSLMVHRICIVQGDWWSRTWSWVNYDFGHSTVCTYLLRQIEICLRWLLGKMKEHPKSKSSNQGM